MKNFIFAGVLSLTAGFLHAEDTAQDSRMGQVTYYGTGYTERSPEYGDAYFSFSVSCQPTAEAVVEQIYTKTSQKIWNTIVSKVSPQNYSETERTYWNDVSGVEAYDPTTLVRSDDGLNYTRRNSCTGQDIEFTDVVPLAYRGTQSFGLRTANLDWLESLVADISKIPQSKDESEVKISITPIKYAVTQATDLLMKADVYTQAADQATGAGSAFEADKKLLKFNETYFVSRRPVASVPYLGEEVGSAVEAGKAPNVLLKVKMRYGFRIDASNLQGNQTSRAAQNKSQYDEIGQATAKADFAESTVTVSTRCHESEVAAAEAIEEQFQAALALVTAFQGGETATELNRFSYVDTEKASDGSALRAIEFAYKNNQRLVVNYFDVCKNEVISASTNLPLYYQAQRTITIRSSHFDAFPKLVSDLRALNPESPSLDSVIVDVAQPVSKITEATKKSLSVEARKNASESLLRARSSFRTESADTAHYGYQNAYLIGVDIVPLDEEGQVRPLRSFKSAAMMAPSSLQDAAPGLAEVMDINIVTRDNQTRPVITLRKTVAFDLRILTEDFLKK